MPTPTRPKFKFIELFAGIGGMRIPFNEMGGECVFSSEIDPACQKIYELNHGMKPAGDITNIAPESIPDHDILLAGFPCQAFSIIGLQNGFADSRGVLFFYIERILREKRPAGFLLENVKRLRSHDNGRTFAIIQKKLIDLGYHIHSSVLNSLDFGLPQKRERTYIVGFRENTSFNFPTGDKTYQLASILEKQTERRYHASAHIIKRRQEAIKTQPPRPGIWHENKSGNISALPYSCALRANASHNYLLVNGERRLTEREMLRLQGFPEDFKIIGSYSQIRKQAGNAVSVPVIQAIAENMISALKIVSQSEKKQEIAV
ncbi:MAG: DNA (cytosine-5-)-methyltransferase [Nitrospinae bacterium CG11_big_fil_rev_8_21_14_0_20_45_15]|nr:MAG: DNA (cytosine-5-)-methyltransferase [Nitrospinae bacterium CG11_big_fil_rev_8_21_14_0_20_45_15]